MKKYPRTKEGMAKRRSACDVQYSKHAAAKQFNPANGEPHTAKWLAVARRVSKRRKQAMTGATLVFATMSLMLTSGCNDCVRVFDSEIDAIDRQSKVLEKQNCILERIAVALEKERGAEAANQEMEGK